MLVVQQPIKNHFKLKSSLTLLCEVTLVQYFSLSLVSIIKPFHAFYLSEDALNRFSNNSNRHEKNKLRF